MARADVNGIDATSFAIVKKNIFDDNHLELVYIDNKIILIDSKSREIMKVGSKEGIVDFIQKSMVDKGIDHLEDKEVRKVIQAYAEHYSGFTYYPYREKIMIDYGKKQYNLFRTNNHYDQEYIEPYMFPTLEKFFNVFFNNEKEKRWFLQRVAYTIQHPDDRLPTCAIFTGVQGSGKDVMRRILAKTLHPSNISNIDGKSLEGSFNSYIAKKLVIFANEVMDWENRKQIENFLKNYVTNDEILVNEKFMPQFHVKNFAFWVFATNDHNFIPFDEMDRRYTIFHNTRVLKDNFPKEHFDKLIKMINEDSYSTDEFHAFYWYLKNLEIADISFVREPLHTVRKTQMIDAKFGSSNFWNVLIESFKKLYMQDKIHLKDNTYYFKPTELFEKYCSLINSFNLKEEEKKLNVKHFKYKITGMNIVEDMTDKTIRIGGEATKFFAIRSEYLLKEILDGDEFRKHREEQEGPNTIEQKNFQTEKMREMDDGA